MGKLFLTLLLIAVPVMAWSSDEELSPEWIEDVIGLDIDDLMEIKVTTAEKRPEALFEVSSAVYVITKEDIRRSPATSIPELLRMVPGMQVAQIAANKWAVTARGFNGYYANKLLVMVDGRSVYLPVFSGTYWDTLDLLLEDIERIEVIRGPGGTLWGANAVNGIINIITKHTNDTQQNLFSTGGGTEERGFGGLRFSGALGEKTRYRVYGKYFNRDESLELTGEPSVNAWDMWRGGFRIDREESPTSRLMAQGNVYRGTVGEWATARLLTPPYSRISAQNYPVSAVNALARWDGKLSDNTDTSLQVYFERSENEDPDLSERISTFDLEFQHGLALGTRVELIGGIGYRRVSDDTQGTFEASFNPASLTYHLFSTFVEGEVALHENVRLTLGSKLERNDFSGFEILPNARIEWTPSDRYIWWGAVSRAVRAPSRADHHLRVTLATFPGENRMPTVLTLLGAEDVVGEDLLANEVGFRFRPNKRFSVDVAAFYNVYDNLRDLKEGRPFVENSSPSAKRSSAEAELSFAPYLVVPLYFANVFDGKNYGLETAGRWTVTDRWQLALGYSFMDLTSHDESLENTLNAPHHQAHVRSYLDLPGNTAFDTWLYWVDIVNGEATVPAYFRCDVRLGWRPLEYLETSIGVQNVFDEKHQEFGAANNARPNLIQRSLYGKVAWQF